MAQYQVQGSNKIFLLTEEELLLKNISKLDSNRYHFVHNNKSIEAYIEYIDLATATVCVVIDQQKYFYNIKNELYLTITKLGFNSRSSNQDKIIKAPMPGIVLKIEVNEGDSIVKGQSLLTLEAMKMENIIKSPSSGKIKSIKIQAAEKVDKNQIMLILE